MKIILFLLLIGTGLLDIALPYGRYEARAIIQAVCLGAGTFWLIRYGNMSIIAKHAVLFAYLAVILLSSVEAVAPWFVILQSLSMAAVFIFSIAYAESKSSNPERMVKHFSGALLLAIVPLISISAVMHIAGVQAAYEYSTGRFRLEGVFEEPATLAAMAGIVIGLAFFGVKKLFFKGLLACLAGLCLIETGSRTFLLACAIATMATLWIFGKRRRWVSFAVVGVLILLIFTSEIFRVKAVKDSYTNYARIESIATLTGRTDLWGRALRRLQKQAVLGFGFTLGTHEDRATLANSSAGWAAYKRGSLPISQEKLHSGYVQSLLDTGFLGFTLYCSVIAYAAFCLFRRRNENGLAPLFYLLVFFATANFAETIIHSAAVLRSTAAWMTLVLALSLANKKQPILVKVPSPLINGL